MSERTLNRELERFGCEVSGSRKVRVARLKRVVREKKAESPALADSIPERQALAQFRCCALTRLATPHAPPVPLKKAAQSRLQSVAQCPGLDAGITPKL